MKSRPPNLAPSISIHTFYYHKLVSILLIVLCTTIDLGQGQATTSCTTGDVVINVTTTKGYLTTPKFGEEEYPANMSCRFFLKAAEGNHILLEIETIETERQLFDQCLDSVTVYRGSQMLKADTIALFCGSIQNRQVSSREANLVVQMQSDEFASGRGARISYIAIRPDECDPGWIESVNGTCLRFIEPDQGVDWVEAQLQCAEQQSNLASVPSSEAYNFTIDLLTNVTTHPWIGYSDTTSEGTIRGMFERDSKIYPDPQPPLNSNDITKDCLYLDMITSHANIGELAYRIGDCRMKQSFLCEKNRGSFRVGYTIINMKGLCQTESIQSYNIAPPAIEDGSTVPAPNPADRVKNGGRTDQYDYTMILLVLVLIVLAVIILYIIVHACKKRGDNRVHSTDHRVGGAPPNTMSSTEANTAAQANVQRRTEVVQRQPESNNNPNNRSPAPPSLPSPAQVAAIPPQLPPVAAAPTVRASIHSPKPLVSVPEQPESTVPEPILVQPKRSDETAVLHAREDTEASIRAPEPKPRHLPPLPIRETTYNTLNTREESFMRTKRTQELFERPKMNVLDNVSAISLDEFWSNDKKK